METLEASESFLYVGGGVHTHGGGGKSTMENTIGIISRNRISDTRSAPTPLKWGFQGQRASIRTRRGEIDYGEHDRHGFVKSMF